ncbi:MAG: methyltransferase [Gammaproteobacteria bacterium HGW-Gammaproteobacteria-1]|jgi:SAM-dependent methyltransferase|nr:MAG: methyltransferase [Gammaproteobacteria bacterium HGW-Gammaproteobacteria-1]
MWASLKRLLQSYRCVSGRRARADLHRWYDSPLGRSLAAGERVILDDTLGNLFGYHLLQVGAPQHADLTAASRISHRMVLVDNAAGLPPLAGSEGCIGLPEALPVAADSLDLLLLPHTLGFADQPHQVLREAERVLIPEGHVAILGFNPWSLWGLYRLVLGWRRRAPWCGRFLSPWRVKDWLSLLGFDTVLLRHIHHRPPLHHPGLLRRLAFLERWGARWWPVLGGGYLLVARKRVATLTPIRPRWRPRRALVATGLAEPTVRKQRHD